MQVCGNLSIIQEILCFNVLGFSAFLNLKHKKKLDVHLNKIKILNA